MLKSIRKLLFQSWLQFFSLSSLSLYTFLSLNYSVKILIMSQARVLKMITGACPIYHKRSHLHFIELYKTLVTFAFIISQEKRHNFNKRNRFK